jgi:hypothetical protein
MATKTQIGERLDKNHSISLSESLKHMVVQKGIKPENFREFIKNYGSQNGGMPRIQTSDWRKLRDVLQNNPALQLVGNINSGKSYLVRKLIENDKNRVYIVLDSHNEFDLPEINQLNTTLQESSKLTLHKEPVAALSMFSMYADMIRREKFPAHYVLVIEEAMRYENAGLKVLLAECRKFIKVMAIMQQKLYNFCPAIETIPYNKFQL